MKLERNLETLLSAARPVSKKTQNISCNYEKYSVVYWQLVNRNKGGSMAFRQGGGGGGGFGGPREMHKAICSDCKKECEVPFKPRDDRPIYCKDCYSKRKDSGR